MNAYSDATGALKVHDNLNDNKVVSVLAVGDPAEWVRQGHALPQDSNLAFVAFEDVSEGTISHYSPTVIYSPVLSHTFDCIELALLLRNIGYAGSYRALAHDLPKPELIEREVGSMCPGLDFKIILQD
jgi:hypothetical protein